MIQELNTNEVRMTYTVHCTLYKVYRLPGAVQVA